MFGWINDCTECLVVTKFGLETWHLIKEKAGCQVDDGGFLRYEYYPDKDTVDLVVAASEVLDLTVDQVLYAFGDYFIDYVQQNGYSNVLECLGANLRDWLSNLNALHDHLQASYPKGFVAPVFWSEDDEDFEGAILVHYHSKRGPLLVPLVVGLLHRIATSYFDVEIQLDELQLQDESVGHNHTSWRLTAKDPNLAHRLRGEEKPDNQDEVPQGQTQFSPQAYMETFRQGGHQAANLRVEEFVKRSFHNPDSELYHALTQQQFDFLVKYWQEHTISVPTKDDSEGQEEEQKLWCYQIWGMKENDPTSWVGLHDLPLPLQPETISQTQSFGGMIPQRGRFPPDSETGALVSVPPLVHIVNEMAHKEATFEVEVGRDKILYDVLYQHPIMRNQQLTELPKDIQDQITSTTQPPSLELVLVVWNRETNQPFHSLNVTDLETTTSAQLYDMVSQHMNMDPILIKVQTHAVAAVDEDEEEI